MQDFSRAPAATDREPIQFKIDDDVFLAAHPDDAPGGAIIDLATVSTLPIAEQAAALFDFLGVVLLPESATLFASRFHSASNPITLEQATNVAGWLIETMYGRRPTVQPSSSPTGSENGGLRSTVSAPSTG